MRFGICGSMVARAPDGTGIEVIEQARRAGYDYIELSLAHVAALPEGDFSALRQRLESSGLPCEACNNFYPRSVRLTGPEVSWPTIEAYTHHALGRAAALGVEVVVFGSSAAKNVPAGFPYYRAWQQIAAVLRLAAGIAAPLGLTIVIEPINRQESNIVNSVAEALALMRRVKLPVIQVLADYYHLALEQEDPAILLEAGPDLRHIHFARVEGRTYPSEAEPGMVAFFRSLAAAGYDGRVSVEGFSDHFDEDAARALALLKKLATSMLL